MRNFRKLHVWNDARALVKEVYSLTNQLPQTEKFGLISQINSNDLDFLNNKESFITSKIQQLQKRIVALIKGIKPQGRTLNPINHAFGVANRNRPITPYF